LIKKIKQWFVRYRMHMLAWIILIIYESTMVLIAFGASAKPLVYVLHYTIIIITFYVHNNLGLPWALENKRWAIWKVPLVIALEVSVYLFCSFWGDMLLTKTHILTEEPLTFSNAYAWKNLYRALYFIAFSSGYYYLRTYNKEREKTEELKRQQLIEIISRQKAEHELSKAQNAFLKAQINPHFLFNTLDFIYHHISTVSPVAADAVIALAEMMRFAIDSNQMGEFISLGDEIDQIANLRYLNDLRKNEELPFRLIYEEELREIRFIPLVLLTLAENIFKHGNLQNGNEAILQVASNDNWLLITSDNISARNQQPNSNRTGLVNIEKRLRYAYGQTIHFDYGQHEDGHFRVSVRIPLQFFPERHLVLPVAASTDKAPLRAGADQLKKHD
jgi:two-component system LytT family sensor kinase